MGYKCSDVNCDKETKYPRKCVGYGNFSRWHLNKTFCSRHAQVITYEDANKLKKKERSIRYVCVGCYPYLERHFPVTKVGDKKRYDSETKQFLPLVFQRIFCKRERTR